MEKVKYTSLTHVLKRDRGWMTLPRLQYILRTFDVSPDLGCLPHDLRKCVAGADIANVTARFHQIISGFIAENRKVLVSPRTIWVYEWDDVTKLFGTPCILECRNRFLDGCDGPWLGVISYVCRVSFPEIGAQYALKIFRRDDYVAAHGPWNEIPAAMGAYHAESRDNNCMHMASLGPVKYMLSDWLSGVESDRVVMRDNKNEIFSTDDDEIHPGNYRAGRRIDFGKTHRTPYGRASYNVRKLYRSMINMLSAGNVADYENMLQKNTADIKRAAHLVETMGPITLRFDISDYRARNAGR